MMDAAYRDDEALIRDKYGGDRGADLTQDRARLAAGEPLAYVIGWIPFLGVRIELDSKPLIPRPETEWWTEELTRNLRTRFGDRPFSLLDLCAGSGAIGVAILNAFPNARVSFAELEQAHIEQIRKNLEVNSIDAARASIRKSDLFENLEQVFSFPTFDVIATNPPYIPTGRVLDASVANFEPEVALFAGEDGLELIRRIAKEAKMHLNLAGELWLECDIENAEASLELVQAGGASTAEIRNDQYGRPRLVVAHYS